MAQKEIGACTEWQNALTKFTECGEAEQSFLDHLNHCPQCQAATDRVMAEQSRGFEELGRLLAASKNRK